MDNRYTISIVTCNRVRTSSHRFVILTLINSVVKKEYEARAPANTVLFNGGTMWLDYTFSLDYDHRRCQFSTRDPPLWYQKGKEDSPPSNTKAMLFEICGIQTHDATTKSHWVADHGMTTPPEGSFVLSLRFYDSLKTWRCSSWPECLSIRVNAS